MRVYTREALLRYVKSLESEIREVDLSIHRTEESLMNLRVRRRALLADRNGIKEDLDG